MGHAGETRPDLLEFRRMRAALIEQVGDSPVVADVPEPTPGEGERVAEVLAAALNPIDISVAAGRFYAGPPQVPYVPCNEGVSRLEDGRRVWSNRAAGYGGNGAAAERWTVDPDTAIEVPDDLDDALAVCLGIAGLTAWLALAWRGKLKEGETVLVLGASGAVGQIAVQAAKLLGAGRVVAAARDTSALSGLGADETIALSDQDALAGIQAHLTIDPLWGEPATHAVEAAAFGGRIVHLGQSASPEATFRSGAVRGKMLSILGFPLAAVPQPEKAAAYLRLCAHAAADELRIEHETFPLERIAEAWERQESYPHRKLVIAP